MTAPEGTKRRGLDPTTRGVLVLAVVVVLGLVLLAKAAPSSSTSVASPDRSTATTTTSKPAGTETSQAVTTTTKPTPPRPAAQVKVLVLNATGGLVPKASAANGAKIKAKGYNTLPPANALARPTTAAYYAPGYRGDAIAVAKVLGLASSVAAPLPTPPPAPNASQANIVVVLGKDTPSAP